MERMVERRFSRERHLGLIAAAAALALTFCITPVGLRTTGDYSYVCLLCGGVGVVVSGWLAEIVRGNSAQAHAWIEYTIFCLANAAFLFILLWTASAIVRLVLRVVRRVWKAVAVVF